MFFCTLFMAENKGLKSLKGIEEMNSEGTNFFRALGLNFHALNISITFYSRIYDLSTCGKISNLPKLRPSAFSCTF